MLDDTRTLIERLTLRAKSRAATPAPVRHLALAVADRVLSTHYGANYSDRCLQASAIVQFVLQRFGIRSTLAVGALCLPQVYAHQGRTLLAWSGFWDADHHVWLATEHAELVDLTVSQLHIHSATKAAAVAPVPAIWWSPIDVWPDVILYLPEGPIEVRLPEGEMEDYDAVLAEAESLLDEFLATPKSLPRFRIPLLEGPESLMSLLEAGEPWVVGAHEAQQRNMPVPRWPAARQRELMRGA